VSITRLPFEEVFADESGGNIKTPQSEYLREGQFPVVDQGKALIAGYVDEKERVCGGGRPAIVFGDHTRCVKYIEQPFCMGADGVKVLRPKIDADLKYLYYYLKQLQLPDAGYDRHFKYLKRTEVVLFPLPEQRRIAAILDKAYALRTKRREALAQLDRLAQSIFVEMFGDPVTNPKGWPSRKLGDLTAKMGSGSTPTGGDAAYKESGISLIRSMNVHDGCFVYKNLAYIDEEQAAKLKNVVVEADDVLLNITGASVARVCRAPSEVLPARVNQHVMIIRPSDGLRSMFLERLLLNASMKTLLLKVGGAGATREAITKADAEELPVIVPPKALQLEFERRTRQSLSLQDSYEAEAKGMDSLFSSLQHRAFRGEL
jgi:type I restriction enzyme S subunit